jgi:hypothetical protein
VASSALQTSIQSAANAWFSSFAYSQWSGIETSAAANSLPTFSAYSEDEAEQQEASVNDVMSLMFNDAENDDENENWGSTTAGGTDLDMF